jgi:hypothetical protein
MTSFKRLLVLLVCLYCIGLYGQSPSITVSDIDVSGSSQLEVPIKVSRFNQIVGLQFTLSWDADLIQFTSVDSFGVDLNENVNFGIEQVESGFLVFSWYDATLSGVSLPDSAVLFNIHFEVNNNYTGAIELTFGDEPAPREIVDTSYKAIPGDFIDGSVEIMMVSSYDLVEASSVIQELKIYPNPIYEKSILSFYSATDLNYLIKIIDQMGRVVYQQHNRFSAGYQQIEVGRQWFPSSGLFRMVIEGKDFLITKNLLVR